ncbi:lytic transglycosylase domain-containing protein [Vibrio barjaei]|nr:lytic transglycosylase domain-containing protein [Vibrio barjaei]MCG9790347.1 lytic transglycosylase domain-containing protein [Vibrio mediterranei]MCY9871922.1 lytic transglycosylase domain-containing protein [Vibrio barjaei]
MSGNLNRNIYCYHLLLWVGLILACLWFRPSHANSRPSESAIQPHLDTLKPYQKQIMKKFEEFNPLVDEIFKQLSKRSLPDSLVLVPMLESSYNPKAISPAKAAGLWQLMPATAKRFGLTVTQQHDQRFEIAPSTHAAMQYLDFLYNKFDGDINLTLAAYNAGEGRVQRAIKRAGSRQFSDLRLPTETTHYVHRFYALLALVDVNSLRQDRVTTMWLFASETHWQQAPLIDLTPLPPLISL